MVRLVPVRTVKSTSEDHLAYLSSPQNKVPNRFRSKHYDRSVFGGDDCVKAMDPCCKCNECTSCPMVVISAGQKVCDKYNITLRTVKEFMDGGLLESLHEESFLIYAQRTASGSYQMGILAALDVADCRSNVIRKHELCVPRCEATKTQRMKHFQSLYMDPVMVMYRQSSAVDALLARVTAQQAPISLDTDAPDCSEPEHLMWCVSNADDVHALQAAFAEVDAMYIADGHHRTAAACSKSPQASAPPSARYMAALIFADSQLSVLSYHRCLRSLGGVTPTAFLAELSQAFDVTQVTLREDMEEEDHEDMLMFLDGVWYQLRLLEHRRAGYAGNPLGDIHAQLLTEQVLQPIFQLQYPEGEAQVMYVDGRSGLRGVQQAVLSGQAAVGFALRKISTQQIMQVADAGHLLPPKATFFDPKPMAGLMLRLQR